MNRYTVTTTRWTDGDPLLLDFVVEAIRWEKDQYGPGVTFYDKDHSDDPPRYPVAYFSNVEAIVREARTPPDKVYGTIEDVIVDVMAANHHLRSSAPGERRSLARLIAHSIIEVSPS